MARREGRRGGREGERGGKGREGEGGGKGREGERGGKEQGGRKGWRVKESIKKIYQLAETFASKTLYLTDVVYLAS